MSEDGGQKSAPVKEACTGQEDDDQKSKAVESSLKTLRWLLKHGADLEKAAILRKLAEVEKGMALRRSSGLAA